MGSSSQVMIGGMVSVVVLVAVLAGIYRLATGINPWPVFILAELPGAGFGFVLLALTTPNR